MTRTVVDLQELALRRRADSPSSLAPKRRVVSRYVLPGLLVGGFIVVFGWTARDFYLPRHAVTIVPVSLSLSDVQTGGVPMFNAAGWVEPRPTPIRVAALASGVVDELLVVEDQYVKRGEPVARLVSEDAELMLRQALAVGKLREAEVAEASAAVDAARTNLDVPAHLELPVAEADAALAVVETELSNLPYLLKRAEARLRLARVDLETKERARQSLPGIVVEQAQSEFDAAQAEVEELTERLPVLKQQQDALIRRRIAAAKRLELLTDERRAVAEAIARLTAANSRLDEAQVAIAEAQLRLDRMTIHSPVDGRVLSLIAQPGSLLSSGPARMEGADSNTVVTMYEPDRLQVRVDVRFEDLPRVGRDQQVEIRSPALREPLHGHVLFLTGYANIQKNTLEVKVSVDDPPQFFKPEMLVDVTFLSADSESEGEGERPGEQYRLLIPRSLVETSDAGPYVWIAHITERVARRQQIALGFIETPDLVEVVGGLTAASRLISGGRDHLKDGDRIDITGEDSAVIARASVEPRNPQKRPAEPAAPASSKGAH